MSSPYMPPPTGSFVAEPSAYSGAGMPSGYGQAPATYAAAGTQGYNPAYASSYGAQPVGYGNYAAYSYGAPAAPRTGSFTASYSAAPPRSGSFTSYPQAAPRAGSFTSYPQPDPYGGQQCYGAPTYGASYGTDYASTYGAPQGYTGSYVPPAAYGAPLSYGTPSYTPPIAYGGYAQPFPTSGSFTAGPAYPLTTGLPSLGGSFTAGSTPQFQFYPENTPGFPSMPPGGSQSGHPAGAASPLRPAPGAAAHPGAKPTSGTHPAAGPAPPGAKPSSAHAPAKKNIDGKSPSKPASKKAKKKGCC